MSQLRYNNNSMSNRELSFEKFIKITHNLKCWKACGFDKILNEVLKRTEIHEMLFNMYKLFFNYSMTSTNVTKDAHIPLDYRGISLLPCFCNGYSSILNKIIVFNCEELKYFC